MITLTFQGTSAEDVLKDIKAFLNGKTVEQPSEPKQTALPKVQHPTNAEKFLAEVKATPEDPKPTPAVKTEPKDEKPGHATADQVCSLFKQLSAKKFADKDGNPGEPGLAKVQGIFSKLGKTRVRDLSPEELDKAAEMAITAMEMPF